MRYLGAIQLGLGLLSFQHGIYAIAAFINVAMGLGSPLDWPPFNQPTLTSFDVRHFWRMFWLQTDSHSLNAVVNYLMRNIFRLQRSGKPARYLRIFLKFVISGIIYAAIGFSLGIPVFESGALRFFAIQPLGIVIDDIVHSTLGNDLLPRFVQSYFSFIWLSLWMTWTAPGYLDPIIHKNASRSRGMLSRIMFYLRQKFWYKYLTRRSPPVSVISQNLIVTSYILMPTYVLWTILS
ncbi:hypothetical protein F4811DRAFT_62410 [Daldinia bambusicola]|nr:hypothetical protein F4811DRAFT_62410 [Daldinia bambusicola]